MKTPVKVTANKPWKGVPKAFGRSSL